MKECLSVFCFFCVIDEVTDVQNSISSHEFEPNDMPSHDEFESTLEEEVNDKGTEEQRSDWI